MFSEELVLSQGNVLHYRCETLTGFKSRICPDRLKRSIDNRIKPEQNDEICQFCPERVYKDTPVFQDNKRIRIGESVTFPNLYPFSKTHIVTVITKEHCPDIFTETQIFDALKGQYTALKETGGYPSINWNNQSSAGASMIHPHMQGISDEKPTYTAGRYIKKSREYLKKTEKNYWDNIRAIEKNSGRYLFGDEIIWSANPVPLGEKEIRGYLPISEISEFPHLIPRLSKDLLKLIRFYRSLGHYAYNMSIYFDNNNSDKAFKAFVSLIARINPNPKSISDSAFMERLHFEPVVLTIPEEIGRNFKDFLENDR